MTCWAASVSGARTGSWGPTTGRRETALHALIVARAGASSAEAAGVAAPGTAAPRFATCFALAASTSASASALRGHCARVLCPRSSVSRNSVSARPTRVSIRPSQTAAYSTGVGVSASAGRVGHRLRWPYRDPAAHSRGLRACHGHMGGCSEGKPGDCPPWTVPVRWSSSHAGLDTAAADVGLLDRRGGERERRSSRLASATAVSRPSGTSS